MRDSTVIPDWEDNTERRLGILEKKMDDILNPQVGIYPLVRSIESRLKSYAIAILTTVVVGIVVQIILYNNHP